MLPDSHMWTSSVPQFAFRHSEHKFFTVLLPNVLFPTAAPRTTSAPDILTDFLSTGPSNSICLSCLYGFAGASMSWAFICYSRSLGSYEWDWKVPVAGGCSQQVQYLDFTKWFPKDLSPPLSEMTACSHAFNGERSWGAPASPYCFAHRNEDGNPTHGILFVWALQLGTWTKFLNEVFSLCLSSMAASLHE